LDFRHRPWVTHSGWPFGAEALAEYYKRASELLQLGEWTDHPDWALRAIGKRKKQFPFDPHVLSTLVRPLSPPTRFGTRYRDALWRSATVKTLLNANAVQLETNADGTEVVGARVKTTASHEFRVGAKIMILCAGGVENARLLLLSNDAQAAGLGNRHGNVGRYFMDHPRLLTGRVYLNDASAFRRLYDTTYYHGNHALKVRGPVVSACIALSEAIQEQEGLLQVLTQLTASYIGEDHPGADHAKAVYKALTRANHRPVSRRALAGMLRALPAVGAAYLGRASRIGKMIRYFKLEAVIEPQPDPRNRVMLSNAWDRLGSRQAHVAWRIGDLERRSHRRAMQLIKRQIETHDLGRVEFDESDWEERWDRRVLSTWHHMGTTRIHPNPREGVVDENCRVHGVSNLFVAGSSVFATGSGQPPTMTIVALALRLADHLRQRDLERTSLESPLLARRVV
jgi:choline dehydrogenase-like flavoprotein